MKYSVVIPVFNSMNVVPETLKRTEDFFKTYEFDYEIILVNDGSADDSYASDKKKYKCK